MLAVEIKNDVNVVVQNLRAMLIDKESVSLRRTAEANAVVRNRIRESMGKPGRTLQAPETPRIFGKVKERRALFVADQSLKQQAARLVEAVAVFQVAR